MESMPQTIVPHITIIDRSKSSVTRNQVVVRKTKEVEALVKVSCTNRLQDTIPMYGLMVRSKINSAI